MEEKKNKERKVYSAEELLEYWGLRVIGSTLKTAGLRDGIGGGVGVDVALAMMTYVEGIADFDSVRPILSHVYSQGQPVEGYRLQRPGEELSVALIRHGWFFMRGHNPRKIPGLLLEQFRRSLEKALAENPFREPEVYREKDALEIGEELSAKPVRSFAA